MVGKLINWQGLQRTLSTIRQPFGPAAEYFTAQFDEVTTCQLYFLTAIYETGTAISGPEHTSSMPERAKAGNPVLVPNSKEQMG